MGCNHNFLKILDRPKTRGVSTSRPRSGLRPWWPRGLFIDSGGDNMEFLWYRLVISCIAASRFIRGIPEMIAVVFVSRFLALQKISTRECQGRINYNFHEPIKVILYPTSIKTIESSRHKRPASHQGELYPLALVAIFHLTLYIKIARIKSWLKNKG